MGGIRAFAVHPILETSVSANVTDIHADQVLDCRKLKCPLPVLKTRKAIEAMASGQVLKMLADIPGSVKCLPIWSAKSGNPIIRMEQEGPVYIYYIQCK